MKAGILGGTFDPVHHGHLILAEKAREAAGLDRVIFIPAGIPPHRGTPETSAAHRLAMVRLAVAGNPGFSACGYEANRPAPSYTLDTLRYLAGRLGPETRLNLILGQDAFAEIGGWHRVGEVVDRAVFLVASRPGAAWPAGLPVNIVYHEIDAGLFSLSAREIRERVKNGRSIRYLVPDKVAEYIRRHGLYR